MSKIYNFRGIQDARKYFPLESCKLVATAIGMMAADIHILDPLNTSGIIFAAGAHSHSTGKNISNVKGNSLTYWVILIHRAQSWVKN